MIDHEAIDELLAGYVLRSLTGEDAEAADRLLTDHVPECTDCRATLDAFQGLTGDIALVAAPVPVPASLIRWRSQAARAVIPRCSVVASP